MEDYNYEEDDGLIALSDEELTKYIQSFDLFLENPYDKARKNLILENTLEFLDNMRKIKTGYYSGFRELLIEISSKIDKAKQFSSDISLLDILNDALDLINNYLKNYAEPEEPKKYIKYPEKKYQKYSYPYFKYTDRESEQVNKEYGKKLAHYLKARDSPNFDRDNPVEEELKATIDNLDSKEEVPDPIDKIFQDALNQIRDKKLEIENRKLELQELSNKKIELSNKKQSLDEYRRLMLGKFIDEMIKTEQER